MSADVRVTAHNLTKVFALRERHKIKGISTDSAAALRDLLRHVLRPGGVQTPPERGKKDLLFALDDVSFEVPAGEVLGIIGRNGAGKTTLLKILARVLDPTAGRATIRGRVVSLLELGIGFAPDLTVRENIQIYGRLAQVPASQIQSAERQILDFARLAEYRDVELAKCPSGSFLQLAFSAMVNLETNVILADEVLAVGDSEFRRACEARIRAVGQSGQSVLFVSHDMSAIRRCCSRVLWIDRGRICRIGPTEEIVRAYSAELLAGRLLPPAEGPLEESCRLLDLRLLDGRRDQVGALQITEPGYIDCLFRVERPEIRVTVQMELWQGKYHVLTSTTPRPLRAAEKTTFRAGLRVPADFLNEASYRAHCRLYVEDVTDIDASPALAAEERIDFSVMNPRPQDSVWADWKWGRGGLICPRLPWTLERSERAALAQESAAEV